MRCKDCIHAEFDIILEVNDELFCTHERFMKVLGGNILWGKSEKDGRCSLIELPEDKKGE